MSSVYSTGYKQTNALYVPIGDCRDAVLTYNASLSTFSQATWILGPGIGNVSTTISGPAAGGLFRDMGKTVMSSGRTFRKVQLVVSDANGGSNGVGGNLSNGFFTGYLEIGLPNTAPVALYPSLW